MLRPGERAVQPYGGETPLLSGSGGASGGLGAPEGDGGGGGKYSIFNLKRYRKHFNVDTQARPAQPILLSHIACCRTASHLLAGTPAGANADCAGML